MYQTQATSHEDQPNVFTPCLTRTCWLSEENNLSFSLDISGKKKWKYCCTSFFSSFSYTFSMWTESFKVRGVQGCPNSFPWRAKDVCGWRGLGPWGGSLAWAGGFTTWSYCHKLWRRSICMISPCRLAGVGCCFLALLTWKLTGLMYHPILAAGWRALERLGVQLSATAAAPSVAHCRWVKSLAVSRATPQRPHNIHI